MGYQLVMIRHGESVWNQKNLFTGWTDVDLSETGHKEAAQGGVLLKEAGFSFDVCYTSYLQRAIHTANHVLQELNEEWIPVIKTWKLNERHYGALQAPYKNVDPKELPLTESLKDTIARVIPFYEENIKKDMLAGKQVLIAAHGNSLRALVKYLDNISENEITELNIPTGVPLVYEFDDNFNVTGHHYLGDQAAIEAKMNAVAKQGAKK